MRTMTFLVCLSLFLFGEARANDNSGQSTPKKAPTQGEPEEFPLKGYRALRETSAPVIENGRLGRAFSFSRGIELVQIETREDASLGTIVRLGIDQGQGLPTDIWVRARDLESADFVAYDFSEATIEEIELWKRMTYCYRHVKRYLLQTGQVKSYLPGGSAYQAATILPQHGFRRTGNGPDLAREGEVCVYGGGPQGHGHIEVKRNGKWWYGYGFIDHPIRNRRFIACFVK